MPLSAPSALSFPVHKFPAVPTGSRGEVALLKRSDRRTRAPGVPSHCAPWPLALTIRNALQAFWRSPSPRRSLSRQSVVVRAASLLSAWPPPCLAASQPAMAACFSRGTPAPPVGLSLSQRVTSRTHRWVATLQQAESRPAKCSHYWITGMMWLLQAQPREGKGKISRP